MKKYFLLIIICLGFQVIPAAAQVVGGITYTPFFL